MYNFSKRNYSKLEVEQIIESLRAEYNARLKEQKNRIFELVSELKDLKDIIQNLKQTPHAENTTTQSKKLLEIAEKCEIYYAAIKDKYPLSSEVEGLNLIATKLKNYTVNTDIKKELAAAKNTPLVKRVYKTKRELRPAFKSQSLQTSDLEKQQQFNPKSHINNFINRQKEQSTFNLDDVLNPKKELNLEELCKELGLM